MQKVTDIVWDLSELHHDSLSSGSSTVIGFNFSRFK